MGTFLGVPIIRIIVYGGLCWGPPFLGNYDVGILVKGYLGLVEYGYTGLYHRVILVRAASLGMEKSNAKAMETTWKLALCGDQ